MKTPSPTTSPTKSRARRDDSEEHTAPLDLPPELRARISPQSAQFRAVSEADLEPPAAIVRVRPVPTS